MLSFPFSVVVGKWCFCVLHSEVFILATPPQGFHFIVIIRVRVRLTIYRITEVHLISDDAVVALSEEVILFVKLSLVLSDCHIKALLFKVRLLLLPHGGLFKHLFGVSESSLPGTLHRRLHWGRRGREFLNCWSRPGVIGQKRMWSSRRRTIRREGVRLCDERIVSFVVDPRVDESAVHTPSTISFNKEPANRPWSDLPV